MDMSTEVVRHVTGRAGNPPGQGPFLWVHLDVVGTSIQKAAYETYQCPGCIACGQAIVALVSGKTIEEAEAVKHDHVVERVGPLAPHRRVCYGLAVLALDDALNRLHNE